MTKLKLINGDEIDREDYVLRKSFNLRDLGFAYATEQEVDAQLTKVLKGDTDLSLIGLYIKDDLVMPQPIA